MVPLLPVLVATSPLILTGAHAAADAAGGMSAGAAGGLAISRIQSLYGIRPAQSTTFYDVAVEYGPRVGYGALIAGAALHFALKAAGLASIKLARNVKLG